MGTTYSTDHRSTHVDMGRKVSVRSCHSHTESSDQSTADSIRGDDKANEVSNSGGSKNRHLTQESALDHKVTLALQRLWSAHEHKEIPFARILLKFPQAAKAFGTVRKTFKGFDRENTGYVDVDEVPVLFRKLGVSFSNAEISQIYAESGLEETGKLTFQEILVSLAITFLVHRMPLLYKTQMSIFDMSRGSVGGSCSTTTTCAEEEEIRGALQLAVDAFLWFDTDGSGYINRNNMSAQLEASMARYSPTKKLKKKAGSYKGSGEDSTNWSIWDRRFAEMDWNRNGTIHFNEFLIAFESWVSVDCDDDDDDDDDDDGGEKSTATYNDSEMSTFAR